MRPGNRGDKIFVPILRKYVVWVWTVLKWLMVGFIMGFSLTL